MNETFCILIRISLKLVPKGPIYNKSALIQALAWCRTATDFTHAYMRHSGEMSLNKVNMKCVTPQNLFKGLVLLVAHIRCRILFMNGKIQDGSQKFFVVLGRIFSYANAYQ